MHKIEVVDECREWVVREMCQIVAEEARGALCRAPCACCGHPIGELQPLRLVALPRGEAGLCHQGCVARLLARGGQDLTHGECLEGQHRGDCRRFFRRLLVSIGGLEVLAGSTPLNNGDPSRAVQGSGKAAPPKRKEPVRRCTSPGRRAKRMMIRAKR